MDKYTLAAIVGSAAFAAALLQYAKNAFPGTPTRFLPFVAMFVTDFCSVVSLELLGQLSWLTAATVLVMGLVPSGGYAAVKAIVAQPDPPAGTTGVGQPIVTTVPNGTPAVPTSTIGGSQDIGRP